MWYTYWRVNMIQHHCQCGTCEGCTESHEHYQIMNKCQETLQCIIHDDKFHLQSHTRMKITSPTPVMWSHFSVTEWLVGTCFGNVEWQYFLLGKKIPAADICAWLQCTYRDACTCPSSGRWQVQHFQDRNPDITEQHHSGCPQTVSKQRKNWVHRRERMCDNQGNGNKD